MDSTSHLRSRTYSIAVSSLIFLSAIAAVTLLARAPFGEIYGTLLGIGRGTGTAAITLYGTTKPRVEMSVAKKEGGAYVILMIEDAVSFDSAQRALDGRLRGACPEPCRRAQDDMITVTIPKSWHLEEVRGAHASDIASYSASERTTLMIPIIESLDSSLSRASASEPRGSKRVELRFTTRETFKAVAFTHDSQSPALFTLTHIILPGGEAEKKVEIVEESAIFPLL